MEIINNILTIFTICVIFHGTEIHQNSGVYHPSQNILTEKMYVPKKEGKGQKSTANGHNGSVKARLEKIKLTVPFHE